MESVRLATFLSILFVIAISYQANVEAASKNEAIVHFINNHKSAGWKATLYPRFANISLHKAKHLFGGRSTPEHIRANITNKFHNLDDYGNELPYQFDAREKWPNCPSIRFIRDQGGCGSCWAFASVEAMSDRFCIHLNANVQLSTNDVLACCGENYCGSCRSGWPSIAWKYFHDFGLVTEECDPYFDQQGCNHYGFCPAQNTPQCTKQCYTNQNWYGNKYYAYSPYQLYRTDDIRNIMAEVYFNGPVSVTFQAYEDFVFYRSGIYRQLTGNYLLGHVVKLIGWGTENGQDYWLMANQYNQNWGEGGYFRIARGVNECGIEEEIDAAMPAFIQSTP